MNPSLTKKISIAISIIFITLCLMHYFSQRPLWFDEQPIGESLQNLSYVQIFGRLVREQAFPRTYLFGIKLISAPFDYHLLAMRFLPLIAMLAAFFVWMKIFRLYLKNDWLYILTLLAFGGSYRMTYYAGELKHYSMEVLVAGLYIVFLHYQNQFQSKAPSRTFFILSSLMPLLLFLSYSSIFFFWIIPFNFLLMIIFNRNRSLIAPMLINIAVAIAACITIYKVDLVYSINPLMTDYFQSYYLQLDSWGGFFTPFGEGVQRMATYWYGDTKYFTRAATIFIPFFFFGMIIYGLKQWKEARFQIAHLDIIGLTVFAELFVLGLLKKYPFTGERITLFFAPFTMYIVVKAMHGFTKIKYLHWIFLGYFGVFSIVCTGNSFYQYLQLYL